MYQERKQVELFEQFDTDGKFKKYIRQKEKDVRNVLEECAGSILGLAKIEKTLTFSSQKGHFKPYFAMQFDNEVRLRAIVAQKWLRTQNQKKFGERFPVPSNCKI